MRSPSIFMNDDGLVPKISIGTSGNQRNGVATNLAFDGYWYI